MSQIKRHFAGDDFERLRPQRLAGFQVETDQVLLFPKLAAAQLPLFAGPEFRVARLDEPSSVVGQGDGAVDDQSAFVKPSEESIF